MTVSNIVEVITDFLRYKTNQRGKGSRIINNSMSALFLLWC